MRAHELIAESLANQTLYHGGEQPVTRFKIPPHGVYFSPHADWAANYGDVITQAQVNADRVYQIDYSHDIDDEIVDALFDRDYSQVAKFVRLLQAQGYQAMQSVTDSEMVVVFPGTHIEVLGNNSIDINESQGPGRHAIPLPIGDYLASGSDEFAPPGNYQSAEDLHDEVYDLIDAGVEPDVVTVDPRTVLATQDWLSNAGGDDPLFDEYPDRPVVYQKAGRLYILDGHHRTTRAWKTGKPIAVYLFSDNNLTEDVYSVLNSYQCGPFDGGCVLVAQALQKIHGGNIVVLVDQSDQAQHAAVAVDGQLMDYSGAAEPMQFIRKFEEDEHVNIAGVRPFKPGDLPEAPSNDNQVIDQLVRALSENFAIRHRYKL